jgi:hypothetical protein
MSNSTSLALRDNKGKPELSQVDPLLLEEVARVLEFGAKKYARNNWRKGQPVTKLLDSGMRHMAAILRGEDIDPESGCKHWAHVCCNMMFLGCQEGREDLDDRYKKKKGEEEPVFVCDAATMAWKYGCDSKKEVIRERVGVGGGGGGKVVDKKEGGKFLTRLRNSQRLQSMGVEEKKGSIVMSGPWGEIEVRNETQEVGIGCDWISKHEEERREAIRKAMKAWEEEEEDEVGEEEESTYDDLDSQNPRSPPGTPPPPVLEGESTDKRFGELIGGNIASEEVNDCMMSHVVIGCKPSSTHWSNTVKYTVNADGERVVPLSSKEETERWLTSEYIGEGGIGEAVTSTYSPDAVMGDFTWKPPTPATQQSSLGFMGLKPPIPPPSETRTSPFKALEREKKRLQEEEEEDLVGLDSYHTKI